MTPQPTTDNQTDVGQTINNESNMPLSVQMQAEQGITALQDWIRGDMTARNWEDYLDGWQTSQAMDTRQAQTAVAPLRRIQSSNTGKFAELVDSLEKTVQVSGEHSETRQRDLQALLSELEEEFLAGPFARVERDLETWIHRSKSGEMSDENLKTLQASISELPEFGTAELGETYTTLKTNLLSAVEKLANFSPAEKKKDALSWQVESAIANVDKTKEKMSRLIRTSIVGIMPSKTDSEVNNAIQGTRFLIRMVAEHPLGRYSAWKEHLGRIGAESAFPSKVTAEQSANGEDRAGTSTNDALEALTTDIETVFARTAAAFKAYVTGPFPPTGVDREIAIPDLTPFETFSKSLVRGDVFIDLKNTQSDDIPYLLNYGVPEIRRDVERLKKLVTDMERGSDESDSAGR